MIIYESKEACIIYMVNRDYVYLTIDGFFDSEQLRIYSNKIVELCRDKKVSKMLFDTSKLKLIKLDDVNWIVKNVLPKLQTYELERIAFITPESSFGLVSMNRLLSMVDKTKFRFFDSIEHAEIWLFKKEGSEVS